MMTLREWNDKYTEGFVFPNSHGAVIYFHPMPPAKESEARKELYNLSDYIVVRNSSHYIIMMRGTNELIQNRR
jgi:hypothetical protein